MKIVFSLASRSRLDKLNETIKNIQQNVESQDYAIFVILDIDDPAVAHLIPLENSDPRIQINWGTSKHKISAINRFANFSEDFDIVVCMSDDMRFLTKGFDEIIRANMPADLDAFLHFRDTNHNPPDALCTLSILGRKYFERDGFIYDPRFKSYFCDNLAQDIAKARGKYKYVPDIIFDHLHPGYGKGENDAQYKANDKNWNRDAMLYKNLKRKIHLLK
jgi:hypothetical protein